MKGAIKIVVSEEDIKRGKPALCSKCPVALAAMRANFPHKDRITDVLVGLCELQVMYGLKDPSLSYSLPEAASEFIEGFDDETNSRELFKPFEFYALRISK